MFVSPLAVLITSMLKDLNAQEKDTITFEVTVNYEGITYKWLKNGVEIRSSDRCQTRTKQFSHSLTIRNVHFGDVGEYKFLAGSAETSAKLFVEGNICFKIIVFKCVLSVDNNRVVFSFNTFKLVSLSSPSISKTLKLLRRRRLFLNVSFPNPMSK